MKHLFIINPTAGKGKNVSLIPEIKRMIELKKEEYAIEVTKGIGHATEIVKNYVKNGDYRVYSVGGDGTLNEVLNGIAGSNSALAVIPSGTGNDFSRNIYEDSNVLGSLEKAINGKDVFLDLAKVNDRYFINIASVGFDAEVVYNADNFKKLPFVGGSLAYILGIVMTVFKYKSVNLNITIDDNKISVKSLLAAIANGKCYGGGIFMTPEAKLDDGMFDVCIIKEMNRLKILRLFPKAIKGQHSTIKGVSFCRGRKVKISCDEDVSLNIDGEILRAKEVTFEIIPKGIKVIMP
jgi:YegS/Rv2252/BmrU family lipid kinase